MPRPTPDTILRVDLTDRTCVRDPVPETWRRRYIGGKGLGARYLYAELDSGTEPLGRENRLCFMLGPLTGYLPGEQRYAVVTKSPLTGAFLDSYAGGTFPGALAGALGDHVGVVVTGSADEPVCLVVEDASVHLEPAADLWGADTSETCAAFPDASVACIGPAGERRVRYATVASDGGDHQAGRGGAGAVMGSKRLKAIVARGDPPSGLADLRAAYTDRFAEDAVGRWQAASETLESVDFADEIGGLATRGWEASRFEGLSDIGIEAARGVATERERDDESIPGGFRVETEDGDSVPRGATQMTLGATLGVEEFDAVVTLGDACDRLGLDVISAGNAVAWAMLAAREGVIDRDLAFGDAEAARELLGEIATRRTPLGDILALGVRSAAAELGARDRIPHVKGLEVPSYDPRAAASMALAYATSDRGACHRRSRPIEREPFAGRDWAPERAAAAVIAEQNTSSVRWSLVADDFVGAVFEDLGAEWLEAVGAPVPEDLSLAGERIWTLTRLFNLREGFTRDDDALPEVFTEPVDAETARPIEPATFERMLDAYYELRGWDADGRPTIETLARLDLLDVVDDETPVDPDR
ncbi:aldehyde ferredoxin oxidoreductase [Halorientalis sp. IM1011]|uniref:aldehyde ferredoxin oxidoreductase family protein n=1 Tax=Halorientalis sp. IM1011 TaxID=1932360 RepID=UPI00097CC6B0|nr:aldehyde ferredoxin oxidoreductase C-terminal domain-containing protein [Halorientalis sp. IM1011]AQL43261.1 aldehyde ferredoxin oxidoreductase [Halorientalis sp. IM1011]